MTGLDQRPLPQTGSKLQIVLSEDDNSRWNSNDWYWAAGSVIPGRDEATSGRVVAIWISTKIKQNIKCLNYWRFQKQEAQRNSYLFYLLHQIRI